MRPGSVGLGHRSAILEFATVYSAPPAIPQSWASATHEIRQTVLLNQMFEEALQVVDAQGARRTVEIARQVIDHCQVGSVGALREAMLPHGSHRRHCYSSGQVGQGRV